MEQSASGFVPSAGIDQVQLKLASLKSCTDGIIKDCGHNWWSLYFISMGIQMVLIPDVLSILEHHHTIKAGKKYKKKWLNSQQNSQNWPEGAVKGQKFAFSLLKINNTIAGRDGLDKYQLWRYSVMNKLLMIWQTPHTTLCVFLHSFKVLQISNFPLMDVPLFQIRSFF